jgi:protein-S-isoprenylcysteine O-methyltransferase Ste14
LLCAVLFFAVVRWIFIPFEEEKMENSFGKEYLEYKQRVPRWL